MIAGNRTRRRVHREDGMSNWLRRIRGAIGMGLAWGFAWFSAGMILLAVVGPDAADVPFPIGFGFLGFLGGITFSGVLKLVAGRRRFDEISLPRFSGWGALGGVLLSVIFVVVVALTDDLSFLSNLLFLGPLFGAAGAGCAAGTLALARMAEDGDLLEAGGSEEDGELPEGELKALVGDGG